jgi:hypothetical protein
MNHRWELHRDHGQTRAFVCKECGAGPVYIHFLDSKSKVTKVAKETGIEPDCKNQQVKEIMDK